MKYHGIATALILTLSAGPGSADNAGPYGGFKGGYYTFNNLDSQDNLDENFGDYAWGAYAGYKFKFPVAAEVEYLTLREDNTPSGVDVEGAVFMASLKPTWTLGQHFELYAKLGWAWWDVQLKDGWNTQLREHSLSWHDGFIGFGGAVHYQGFHLRLEHQLNEVETHLFDDADSELFTLGIGYSF